MEKYSVVQVPKLQKGEKTSSTDERCPLCNALAVQQGNIRVCPNHGSRPWEPPPEPT